MSLDKKNTIYNILEEKRIFPPSKKFAENSNIRTQEELLSLKKQASDVVAQEATRCGAAYVNQRWLGGMLTNWTTMKARIERLKDLERMESSGSIAMRPKKEAAVLRRELERLQKYLGGLKGMRRLPDVVVLVDQSRESNAVLEARKLDISLVSMLDTNCDPDLCEVPIPCNDDAVRSVQLILGRLADAINEGRKGSNAERKN